MLYSFEMYTFIYKLFTSTVLIDKNINFFMTIINFSRINKNLIRHQVLRLNIFLIFSLLINSVIEKLPSIYYFLKTFFDHVFDPSIIM